MSASQLSVLLESFYAYCLEADVGDVSEVSDFSSRSVAAATTHQLIPII